MRFIITAAVLGVVCVAAAVVAVLGSRNVARLELVDTRLRDTGRFAEARARLQRRAFEMLPATLPGDNVLVQDILLQLDQAGRLGERLPDDVRATLAQLVAALDAPAVLRDDLVVAAALLESIVDAESVVQERIFADARSDIRYERNATLAGLLVLTALALLGVWTVPKGAAPFRPLLRAWVRGILDQRKTLLRAERLALAGEAAASLAHEIRNPLAGVTLGLQNQEREVEELGPRVRPMVSELERVGRTLNEHLGALRAPAEAPTDVDVALLVSDLVELLRYEASDGVHMAVEVPAGLRCRTQHDRLRQVLLTLGLNALQAMESSGGTLRLEASTSEGALAVCVRDTGPGFPAAVLQGVAGPFTSSRPGGVGLGLRLVRRMVGEMGGSVTLANPEGGGARVDIRIPCAEEPS
ncbi:MAG: hypothetical protein FIA95_03000 [Gemmatimonadetes bacterium]|nr:hypothetical protein [Gemmatimonadota bacterium]